MSALQDDHIAEAQNDLTETLGNAFTWPADCEQVEVIAREKSKSLSRQPNEARVLANNGLNRLDVSGAAGLGGIAILR